MGFVPQPNLHDYPVKLTEAQKKAMTREIFGTSKDPQYAKALEILNQKILASQKGNLQSAQPVGKPAAPN